MAQQISVSESPSFGRTQQLITPKKEILCALFFRGLSNFHVTCQHITLHDIVNINYLSKISAFFAFVLENSIAIILACEFLYCCYITKQGDCYYLLFKEEFVILCKRWKGDNLTNQETKEKRQKV